jgi:hypothetical protein
MLSKVLILSLAVLRPALAEWMVVDQNGRIVLQDALANVEQLTDTGRDFGGRISCDQRTVVFVRSSPEDPFNTSIHAIDISSREDTVLLDEPIAYLDGRTHYLTQPQLGPDGRVLYVLAQYGMSTGGVLAIDVDTKTVTHIADAAAFILIRSGEHAGEFLIDERKVSITGRIYYVYKLYSADGNDLGLAGPGDMDISSFGCNRPDVESVQEQAVPTTIPASEPPRKVLQVPAKVMAARLESHVDPAQTVPADTAAVDRLVNLIVTVSQEGKVIDIQLLSGPPHLVPAATAAVRQLRYKPYEVNGERVQVVTEVNVPFPAKQ